MQKSKYVVTGRNNQIFGPFDTWIEGMNWLQSLDPIPKFEVLPVYNPDEYTKHQGII